MATKQKYYVLENGEYVVKYRDAVNQPLKNKLSPDRTTRQQLQKLMLTPKLARNTTSFHIDSHSYASKKLLSNKKFIGTQNEELEKSSYSQCVVDKQPDERLCHITLQLTSRIKKLEEQNEYLREENKHFAVKLSFHMDKNSQYKQVIKDLQDELEQVRFNYQDHMRMYKDLCVAYEGLAEDNKKLLYTSKIKESRQTNTKANSNQQSQQMQSVSQDGQSTFRTHNVDDIMHKTQFKIQRYAFEIDLLKHQLMEKDSELNDVLNQLRETETNLNNSKLTEDFLITELEKTKAIVFNQKLLEEALNQKITRIVGELKMKQNALNNLCEMCHSNILLSSQISVSKFAQATKVDSDEEQNAG